MEVTDVETHLVRGAEGSDARHHCFLRIHTDDGPTGVGEATAPGMERGVEGAVRDLGRHLLGRDPLAIEAHWDRLYDAYAWNWGPVSLTALSGIEMALWDLAGKHHGARVCDLLGGAASERVKVYANGLVGGDSPDEYAASARAVAERGFDVTKFSPFTLRGEGAWLTRAEREAGAERVAAVREAVGHDLEFGVELHGVHTPAVAADLARRVAPHDPLFVEEPVPPENTDAMRRVRERIDLPIATGERLLTVHDYRDLLRHPAPADVVQPDVTNCGGISQLKKIAAMAAAEYLPVAPHNSRGPVATAAAAHAVATTPNFLILEYFPDLPPWRGDLTVGAERVEDGFYHLPEGPGLGVELDDDALAAHGYEKAPAGESVYSRGYRHVWE
jgi:galactonate dehydratase